MKTNHTTPTQIIPVGTREYKGYIITICRAYSNRYARWMYNADAPYTTDPNKDTRWFTSKALAITVEKLNIDSHLLEKQVADSWLEEYMPTREEMVSGMFNDPGVQDVLNERMASSIIAKAEADLGKLPDGMKVDLLLDNMPHLLSSDEARNILNNLQKGGK